ncbi:ABC transporter ATP-binding protein [Anaerosporobacter faecicola]|uniref:ABC transporter ATP-binding protein n=1 Tax=Anaerosporobacter faecicola TaxID=2718714 RepID=UPI001439FCD2|nr:ABC transporter ATP-binding protein [Anaerosporobacter faecicola]
MKKCIIQTKDLCKSYINGKSGNHVLKNISVTFYEGDFTIIMGSSGSGKSTLLYSISTMDKPTGGSVNLLGQDITKIGEQEAARIRNKEISMVFQSINLLPDLTAKENVAYPGYRVGKKQEINEKVDELFASFGLTDQSNKHPAEMSGGQQQRVAIARALVTSPKILFADEPTGALNSSSSEQVLDLMTEINEQGQSIIMVTHDIKACARGNRLLFLSDGHITGDITLGKYNPEEKKEREETIFQFLKEHNW